jgi:hypothetical protein
MYALLFIKGDKMEKLEGAAAVTSLMMEIEGALATAQSAVQSLREIQRLQESGSEVALPRKLQPVASVPVGSSSKRDRPLEQSLLSVYMGLPQTNASRLG